MQEPPTLDASGALERFPSVGLAELPEDALMRRFDRKFLVKRTGLPGLVGSLPEGWRVLEESGERSVPYRTVYFDTPDLRLYRDHVQGRRHRYKVRIRHYGTGTDTGTTMLELKLKGHRGETIKQRWPVHPGTDDRVLDDGMIETLALALQEHYGWELPRTLTPVAFTHYTRTALVSASGDRLTIDEQLGVSSRSVTRTLGVHTAIVEAKTALQNGAVSRLMRHNSLPARRISKYAVALAATRPEVRGNRWLSSLRRLEALSSGGGLAPGATAGV